MGSPANPSFYFGVMSPYSWLAAERIERVLPHARWRGVLAGVIFRAHGRTSWGLTEGRADGIAACEERAFAYGLGPIVWPDPWPTSDLLAGRAMAYCERCDARALHGGGERDGPSLLKTFALTAMRMAFLEGIDLEERDAVLEAGRRSAIDARELADALGDQKVKDELRAITAEALAAGVFGVPTVVVGDELYWGQDRLGDAAGAYRAQAEA
jgi:2-hydroxychromene-2-carboxylate isomerase